jgi:hypothetical protein
MPMLWLEQLLISIKIATVLKLGGKTENSITKENEVKINNSC